MIPGGRSLLPTHSASHQIGWEEDRWALRSLRWLRMLRMLRLRKIHGRAIEKTSVAWCVCRHLYLYHLISCVLFLLMAHFAVRKKPMEKNTTSSSHQNNQTWQGKVPQSYPRFSAGIPSFLSDLFAFSIPQLRHPFQSPSRGTVFNRAVC